jgi:hypothetical protein
MKGYKRAIKSDWWRSSQEAVRLALKAEESLE